MALVPSVIENAFAALITTNPADAQAAADAIAAAYNTYALAAQAGVVPPVFTGLEQPRFSVALFAALQNNQGAPATTAAAFVAAVTSFWLTPPVLFGAGAVTAFPGAPALLAALTSLFSVINDGPTAAAGIAAALDTATRTVTVMIGPNTFTLN